MNIQMLDLRGQYRNIKEEVDRAVASVIEEAHFINGSEVDKFASELGLYLDSKHVIPCDKRNRRSSDCTYVSGA